METGDHQDNPEKSSPVQLVVLDVISEFINQLEPGVSAKIYGAFKYLRAGEVRPLLIKPLKGEIMELSVKQYRIIFFRAAMFIYVIDVFKKQSEKTPIKIIRRAEKRYQKIILLTK